MPITQAVRSVGTTSQGRLDQVEVEALVELCDAQTAALDRVRRALDTHRAAAADQLTIRQMLAHELRTPLAVVIGALGTLASAELDPQTRSSLVGMANRQALHLSEIVDDIVHLSSPTHLEAPRTKLERVSLLQVLREACDVVRPEIEEPVEIDVAPNLVVATVPAWLRQIAANLMGHVDRLGVSPLQVRADRRDEMLVIEMGGRVHEFDPDAPGLPRPGVGLYVVRALARALGGSAEVDSAELGDSTSDEVLVRVSLPQRRTSDL